MAYTKTAWQDSPSTATPINATNLNHIEGGIYDAHTGIATLDTTKATKQEVSQLNNDLTIASTSESTTISDSSDGYIRDFSAYGKSEQGENPTPENPQEIKSWDGDVRTTKNVVVKSFNWKLGFIDGDSGTKTPNNNYGIYSDSNIPLNNATKIHFELDSSVMNGNTLFFVYFWNGSSFVGNQSTSKKEFDVTVPSNATKFDVCYFAENLGISTANTIAHIHDNSTLASIGISLYGIKVASGGNYTDSDGQQWIADKLDLKKGVVERYVGSFDLSSSALSGASWGSSVTSGIYREWCYLNAIFSKYKYGASYLNKAFTGNSSQTTPYSIFNDNGYMNFVFDGTERTSDEQKALILQNPIVYGALKTPTTETLTDAQISALKGLQTYSDGTFVEYGTLQPFASIDYFTDTDNGKAVAEVDAKYHQILDLLSAQTTSDAE